MAMRGNDIVSTLNRLIETCKDAERGFRQAAERVDDPRLRALFLEYAGQRAQFATELQREVRRVGGDPETAGTAAGALHRGWLALKAAITGRDARAIVAAAETGEDTARQAYEAALGGASLPADVRALVERQYARLRDARHQVRELRRAA